MLLKADLELLKEGLEEQLKLSEKQNENLQRGLGFIWVSYKCCQVNDNLK